MSVDWRTGAPCATVDPDVMHPDRYDGSAVQQARSACARCPRATRYECLNNGDRSGDFSSVRSGLTGEQRAQLTAAQADYPMLSINHDGLVDPSSLGDLLRLGIEHPAQSCARCKATFAPRTKTQRRCTPCAQFIERKCRTPKAEREVDAFDFAESAQSYAVAIAQWKRERLSDASIGLRMGVSSSTVRRMRQALGIPKLTIHHSARGNINEHPAPSPVSTTR